MNYKKIPGLAKGYFKESEFEELEKLPKGTNF